MSPYIVVADKQDRSESDTRALAAAMHEAYDAFAMHHRTSMQSEKMTPDERIDNSIALRHALTAYTTAKAAFEASIK